MDLFPRTNGDTDIKTGVSSHVEVVSLLQRKGYSAVSGIIMSTTGIQMV